MQVTQDVGPWRVVMTWPGDRPPVGGPTSLTVEPGPSATTDDVTGGLSSTYMRRINFGQAVAEAREQYDGRETEVGPLGPNVTDERMTKLLRTLLASGVTDGFLAVLSGAYVHLVNEGNRAPTNHLAEMTGRSPATVRDYIKEARSRGLLTSVAHRAGGETTPKASELLKEWATTVT